MTSEPVAAGKPIASGRSADIYDLGDGRVLRRARHRPIPAHEADAMRLARAHGVPVPRIDSVDGFDMVMERVTGSDMLSRLGSRPWKLRALAAELADLHRRVAAVPIDGVDMRSVIGAAEALVHGDLHPGNVILTASGPVVIDWESAGLGPRDADVATMWLLTEIADIDELKWYIRPVVGLVRRRFLEHFLAATDRPRPATITAVCDHRLRDHNMRDVERVRISEFREAHGGR